MIRPAPLRLLLAVALLATASSAAAGGGVTVSATDNEFAPRAARAARGETVTWVNNGRLPHEVTAVDGSFASGDLEPGASFRWTATRTGDVSYYCRYHGTASSGMVGTLSVSASRLPAGLPNTGGGRQVAAGVAVLLVTSAVGAALAFARPRGTSA